jgi:undecaprenyl-diphosphatase
MVLFCGFLLAISVSIIIIRNISFTKVFTRGISANVNSCILIVSTTAVATILSQVFKHIFQVPRPLTMLITETGYRFPSGHATVSVAFFAAVIASMYLFHPHWPMPLRRLVVSLSVLLTIGVCAARLVLGVHLPVDILGGVVLGLISALIMISFVKGILKIPAR